MKKTLFQSKERMAVYIFDGTLEMAVALVRLAPVNSRIEVNPNPKIELRNSYGVTRVEKGDGVRDYGNGELGCIKKVDLDVNWEEVK